MRYISVNVAGLHISGGTGKIVLAPQGLDGWDDGVDMRRNNLDRAHAHGSYAMPGYLDSRVVSITGRVLADSPAECERIGQRLTGLMADGQMARMQVTTETGTQWADCFLSARTRFTPDYSRRNAAFQIQLWCPDPWKFGDANVYTINPGQTVPLFHYGNAAASPIFEVTGDMPSGYTLRGPDSKTFVAPTSVASARKHLLDMSEGLLKVNGYYWTGQTANADLWTIPPGQQVNTGLTTTGTGTAKVTVYDTFI